MGALLLALRADALQSAEPTSGERAALLAAALFAAVPAGALSPRDRVVIAMMTPLTVQDGLIVSNEPGCTGQPMQPIVRTADLNGDRMPEVLLVAGNTCTSGVTGSNVWLYARRRDGSWARLMDVVAGGYRILQTSHNGWRDLELTGRGPCMGIWQRSTTDGYRYAYSNAGDGSSCPKQGTAAR